jgi:hypothetical protein
MGYNSRKKKMAVPREYRFKITAYTPATIPMVRLAEYMLEIAVLLGEEKHVHFVRLQKGSTVLVPKIENESLPKVEERLTSVRQGKAPSDAIQSIRNINRKLREDNGVGILSRGRATILKFPDQAEKPLNFGTFLEEGSLDGVIIRVGGESDPVPIHLQLLDQTKTHLCDADRGLAKQLAKYLFDTEIRVHGTGKWIRDELGVWSLERFRIKSFEELNDLPLTSVVASLRTITGSEWPTIDDPWAELNRIRNGPASDNNGSDK